MTKKEAIEIFKIILSDYWCGFESDVAEALDLAIKALEQPEIKGDLISREALKKAFDDYIKSNPNVSGIFEVGKFIIDNAPTIPLRLMTVEECAGHTIDYAMGWKACIEWIKKGGKE